MNVVRLAEVLPLHLEGAVAASTSPNYVCISAVLFSLRDVQM